MSSQNFKLRSPQPNMLVHILIIVICYIRERVNNKQRYVFNLCIMTILFQQSIWNWYSVWFNVSRVFLNIRLKFISLLHRVYFRLFINFNFIFKCFNALWLLSVCVLWHKWFVSDRLLFRDVVFHTVKASSGLKTALDGESSLMIMPWWRSPFPILPLKFVFINFSRENHLSASALQVNVTKINIFKN